MAIISLEGIQFFAHHGVHEFEQVEGNQFVVDVYLETVIAEAATRDDIKQTVDYESVYEIVKNVFDSRQNLLESLVNGIGMELKKKFQSLHSVRVRVSKLNPPVGGLVERAYVEDVF